MWGKTLGLLSLLSEDDTELQSYALKQLELSVLTSWPQIADKLDVIKNLAKKKIFLITSMLRFLHLKYHIILVILTHRLSMLYFPKNFSILKILMTIHRKSFLILYVVILLI